MYKGKKALLLLNEAELPVIGENEEIPSPFGRQTKEKSFCCSPKEIAAMKKQIKNQLREILQKYRNPQLGRLEGSGGLGLLALDLENTTMQTIVFRPSYFRRR
jgi:hypothetical protein